MSDRDDAAERSLFLTGMMGAGKSTLGRRLAQSLGRPFIDTDAWIEAHAGMTVSEIFACLGETEFRDWEHAAIEAASRVPGAVVALGGGALLQARNRAMIREAGVTCYLAVPVEELARRLENHAERPLIAGDTTSQDPLELLRRLQAEREPRYREAQLIVDNGGDPETSLERLRSALRAEELLPERSKP